MVCFVPGFGETVPPIGETIALAGKAARFFEAAAPEGAVLSEQVFKDSISQLLRHPKKLVDALPRLAEAFEERGIVGANMNLPEIARTISKGGALGGMKVTRYLGSGESEFVLATENNTALKLSAERLPRSIANSAFDAPVLSEGRIGDRYYYYEQPIGNTRDVEDKHVLDVIKRIRQNGHVDDDMWSTGGTRKDQVALFGAERRPLLIDQRSAVARYGTAYEGGALVPHAAQQANLGEINDYLQTRKIVLNPTSITKPINPETTYDRVFSSRIGDNALKDKLIGHLETVGHEPTLSNRWTNTEIEFALRSLSLR